MLEALSKSIFLTLSKKPVANKCELYQAINLMSHRKKLIIRILMMSDHRRIRPEIVFSLQTPEVEIRYL